MPRAVSSDVRKGRQQIYLLIGMDCFGYACWQVQQDDHSSIERGTYDSQLARVLEGE